MRAMRSEIIAVIDELGGLAFVAQELGVGKKAISRWFDEGIAQGRVLDVLDLAARTGVPLPLERLAPLCTRRK